MIDRAADLGKTAERARQLSTLLRRCWSALQERRKRARLRDTLYGLGSRDLKDIGIAWSEIEYLALNGTEVRVDPRRQPPLARYSNAGLSEL
jgi:uncharacterized protein YjiS (DUF1127 family)